MSGQEFSNEDVAAFWNGNAVQWASLVRDQRDIAREFHNNPAFLAVIGDVGYLGVAAQFRTRVMLEIRA